MLFVRKIRPFNGKTKHFNEIMVTHRFQCNNISVLAYAMSLKRFVSLFKDGFALEHFHKCGTIG